MSSYCSTLMTSSSRLSSRVFLSHLIFHRHNTFLPLSPFITFQSLNLFCFLPFSPYLSLLIPISFFSSLFFPFHPFFFPFSSFFLPYSPYFSLFYLFLSYFSHISGKKLPSTIGNLVALQYLDLSGNAFSGTIPVSFGQLTNAWKLSLSSNMLTGTYVCVDLFCVWAYVPLSAHAHHSYPQPPPTPSDPLILNPTLPPPHFTLTTDLQVIFL